MAFYVVATDIVYTEENYWETLSDIDCIIDALGEKEFDHEFSVLRENGILLSLRGIPNGAFAQKNRFSLFKRFLFTLAGVKYDGKAKRQAKSYRFLFVRTEGSQLEKNTQIVEANHIVPRIDPHEFDLSQIDNALQLVADGHMNGKVILRFQSFLSGIQQLEKSGYCFHTCIAAARMNGGYWGNLFAENG